jgi:hypothetical protein
VVFRRKKCLLAAVALQKIHRVYWYCVAAYRVAVVVHGCPVSTKFDGTARDLVRCNFAVSSGCLPGIYCEVSPHYITGMTRLSFHYMLCFWRVAPN